MRPLLLALVLPFAARASAHPGAALFDANGCRACHRVGPRGGGSGPDLTMVGLRRPRAWLELWLKSPHAWKADTEMPEQGLSAADRAELAEFLSDQKGQEWGGRAPWRADGTVSGRLVYERAGCVACHGPRGRGGHPNPGARGDAIPALAPLMGTYTAAELKSRIQNGVTPEGHDGKTPAVVMPAWRGALNDDELDALTKYLLSLAEGQPKTDW